VNLSERYRLSLDEKRRVIDEAVFLGAQVLLIPGAGEPLLDDDFLQVIEHAHSKELVSVVYTNGILIDKEMALFLFKHNVTPLVKVESLDRQTHDWLTCVPGSFNKACSGLANLFEAGYGSKFDKIEEVTRIGTATLYLKQNLADLASIKDFFGSKGIKTTFDILSISGRARQWMNELKPSFSEILTATRSLHAEESVCPKNNPCRLWQYGIMITNTGEASFCTASQPEIGNVRDYRLRTLVERKDRLFPIRAGTLTCPVKEVDYAL
jgi:MoaA/NifB/PqqE/SkfB family radical SAM enzyme